MGIREQIIRFRRYRRGIPNLELKLISLAIATILWIMVTGKDYRYGDFSIPIEFRGLSEDLIISALGPENQEVNNVTVRVRASETVIRTIDERSMFLRVNLENLGVGQHLIQLDEEMVTGRPPGVEVTDIFPRTLEVEIEQLMLRSFVPVNPEILGKPADGFELSQIITNPPSVSLQGPKSLVSRIEKVSTRPVNVDGFTEINLRRSVSLVTPHPRVTIIPDDVTLRIQISEKRVTRHFENVPVEVRGAKANFRLNPQALGVWVQGPISQVERLSRRNIGLFVTLGGNEPSRENLRLDPQVQLVPPDSFPNVRLERLSQGYVDIFLTPRR